MLTICDVFELTLWRLCLLLLQIIVFCSSDLPVLKKKMFFGLNLFPEPDTTRELKHFNNCTHHPQKLMWNSCDEHAKVSPWHCTYTMCDTLQTEQAALQTLWGVWGFHVTVCCVVVWWGVVRMGPAYRTAVTPKRDGGEPCGCSRRSAAAEIHHTGQEQAGALNCSLTTPKATSTLCYYILLSIITWLIIWVWHAWSCQLVAIVV